MAASAAATAAFEYIVIGAGSGGIASARRAAQAGMKVALIERSRLGGTCVNVGCVPKKVMWHAAELRGAFKLAHHYGMPSAAAPPLDMPALKAARDAYIARLNGIYRDNALSNGITIISGDARFLTASSVVVKGADAVEQVVTAPHILIATGGAPVVPDVPGAELGITSDGFFDLQAVPRRVGVIGGGYIAVEMSGILNALGASTSLLVRGGILRGFDDAIRASVRAHMVADGIRFLDDVHITKLEARGEGDGRTLWVHTHDTVHGDAQHGPFDTVLFATGRAPVSRALSLPSDVQLDEHGHVVVDEFQNSTVPGVYAVGDACVIKPRSGTAPAKRWHLTPVAIAAGRLLADRLFRNMPRARLEYENVPSVVFSHPPVGAVGLTQMEAEAQYTPDRVKVFRASFTPLVYGIMDVPAKDKPKTVMLLVCVREGDAPPAGAPPGADNDTLRVVGLHVHGEGADEMLQAFAIAVKMRATKADFDAAVAIHPTAAEEFVTMAPWMPPPPSAT